MYTVVIHPLRKAYNLSIHEYCVLSSIHMLSNNRKFGGWCIASKKKIADELDLSERAVFNIISTLIEKELVEKNDAGYLRTLDEWNEKISNKQDYYLAFDGKESSFVSGKIKEDPAKNADTMQKVQGGMKKFHRGMKKMQTDYEKNADYIYKDNNNNNNNNNRERDGEKISPTPAQEMRSFIEAVKSKNNEYEKLVQYIHLNRKIPRLIISAELDKFVGYWTELNKSGTKQRWQIEKTFEVKRRLTTWFSKMNNFKKQGRQGRTIT